ncbi:hypothetical protein [Shimia sediminis]|uniref:hypothetical protein n=1 Tax=Shimia sediminis TaxID=2497945 RepID=UPI000F8D6A96|nr:hypothetical protein [Shimia sediminis]
MNTGMKDGKLVIDMAEADEIWSGMTNDQRYESMCIMFEPLLERATAMKRALEPFSKMAGELFARNYSADDCALLFYTPEGERVEITFGDFLCVRDALDQPLT